MNTQKFFLLLTGSVLSFLSLAAHAHPEDYFECSQVCGYTAEGPLLTYQSKSEVEARQLVAESCVNMGRTLQGTMQCQGMSYYSGEPNEHYWECVHGTVDQSSLSTCETYGKIYVVEKGKQTLNFDSRYNSSPLDFVESDKKFHEDCERNIPYYPNAKVRCLILYRVAY